MMSQAEQALLDYDDLFSGLSPDILKNIHIRIYTMQDYFQFQQSQLVEASSMEAQNIMPPTPATKNTGINMFYNRLIAQCLSDLYIMNKLIYTKAKNVNTILDNGKSIAIKKSNSWADCIREKGFQKVRAAYQLLSPCKRNIIKYALLSLSNLLLKLSINMSKVSIIPLQKFLNFECLNIPALSVIFLQYLQFKLYKSKNLTDQIQKVTFLRQFPKVTYLKLGLYKNNTELELMQNSQYQFITSQVDPSQPVKNLQYIQIHQRSNDPIMPNFQRKTKYEHMHCFDLQKMTNGTTKSPFNFEILQIMKQIVFPLIKQFKPDLIVYLESYPTGTAVMNDQARALMLCQMAEFTCVNKMYVFKEVGPDKLRINDYIKANQGGQKINPENCKIFQTQQLRISNKFGQKLFIKPEDKKGIQKIKKGLLNQLCFISLALIQKSSFQSTLQLANTQFFKKQLLQGIARQQTQIIQKNEKSNQGIIGLLKVQRQFIKSMLENNQARKKGEFQKGISFISAAEKNKVFKTFYNLQSQREQQLKAETTNSVNQYYFKETDNLIVKYYDNQKRMLVIIIKYQPSPIPNQQGFVQVTFLSKSYEVKTFKQQLILKLQANQNYIEGATYVCSNDYIYRGFGKFRISKPNSKGITPDPETNYNKAIHRLQINPIIGKNWQLVDNIATPMKPDGKQQPKIELEKKIYGFGLYDTENKTIMMMGGYIDANNEQKVSKTLYIIRGADIVIGKELGKKIFVMGKTNKIVFTATDNVKNIFLHPFVFGIPFVVPGTGQKGNGFVLNTNGSYQNLNHVNKIYASNLKLSNVLAYNGINIQHKLLIHPQVDKTALCIFLAQILIKCIVNYPNQINLRNNQCCVQTLDEGNILMEISLSEKSLRIMAPLIFEDYEWKKINFI